MLPTLKPGNYVLVSKFAYNLRTPIYIPFTDMQVPFLGTKGFLKVHHGDIAVFNKLDSTAKNSFVYQKILIKRVGGVPGDFIRKQANITIVNSQSFVIPWYYEQLLQTGLPDSTVDVIPSKYYFMAGDNRTQSFDSRYFGLVPEENLIGRAEAVLWPWPPRWIK